MDEKSYLEKCLAHLGGNGLKGGGTSAIEFPVECAANGIILEGLKIVEG